MRSSWARRSAQQPLGVVARSLGIIGCSLSIAHGSDKPENSDLFEDIPVVLSGTRLYQSLHDSPAAITVIDREDIEASGAREIVDLLRLVPGFQVGLQSGHTPVATYHGLSDQYSRRIQVLVDNRSVYNAAIGGIEWTSLPLSINDIERLEVIRGPNAATHGSNSFLSVINIVTRHPSVLPTATGQGHLGSDGIGDGFFRHAGALGELSYRASLEYRSDDGFPSRHDDKEVGSAYLRGDYQLSSADTLELQLGYNRNRRQTGFPDSAFNGIGVSKYYTHYQQLRLRRLEPEGGEWSLQVYHNYERLSQTRDGLMILPVDASGKTERYDLELFRGTDHDPTLRSVVGLGLRRDEVSGEGYFNTNDTLTQNIGRAFGNLEWRPTDSWTANVGAMWEHFEDVGSKLSPRVSVAFHLDRHNTVRTSWSRAYRYPVFFERSANIVVELAPPAPRGTLLPVWRAATDLDPERIDSAELGYVGSIPDLNLTLDARLFWDELDDLVVNVPSFPPPAQTWSNLFSARVRGAEAQLKWQPNERSRLTFGYAYAETSSASRELEDSTPRHTLSLMGSYRFLPDLTGSALYSYVSDQLWLDAGDLVPSHDRLDLRLAYSFRAGPTRGEIAAIVQNLLGDYADFLYSPGNPSQTNSFERVGYLSLSFEY